jgi:acyl-CoA thioester hydrolase
MGGTPPLEGNTHKFPFQIAYCDTDAGGIVYHARYIEIAERARMSWINGAVPPGGDVGLVIRELSVKYMRPLKLADNIIVETVLLERGTASLTVEQRFLRDGEIHAIMKLRAAYIGGDMKPKRIPDEYMAV